jgi:hypothetical protein
MLHEEEEAAKLSRGSERWPARRVGRHSREGGRRKADELQGRCCGGLRPQLTRGTDRGEEGGLDEGLAVGKMEGRRPESRRWRRRQSLETVDRLQAAAGLRRCRLAPGTLLAGIPASGPAARLADLVALHEERSGVGQEQVGERV